MYQHFYFPDRVKYETPARAGLAFETVSFFSADGTQLSGWFIPATTVSDPQLAIGTVLHLHGNAQNMSAHWAYTEWLPARGYNVFVFDYRGFGQSHGLPTPQGIFEDSIAALNALRTRTDINPKKIFVFGQSLGGMLAIAAAAASPAGVQAVFAEAPIHSYTALADDQMPALELALDDSYCASSYISKLAPIPLLLVHSQTDRVVPYDHSVALFAAARQPKQFITIENGDHNDAMTARHGTRYQDLMVEFFKAACDN